MVESASVFRMRASPSVGFPLRGERGGCAPRIAPAFGGSSLRSSGDMCRQRARGRGGLSGTTGTAGTSRTQRGGWKMVEDGLANGNKRGKLTGDETNDDADWRITERVAFERMVRHTHTHNALQGELRPTKEARRDVRRAKRSEEKRKTSTFAGVFRFSCFLASILHLRELGELGEELVVLLEAGLISTGRSPLAKQVARVVRL